MSSLSKRLIISVWDESNSDVYHGIFFSVPKDILKSRKKNGRVRERKRKETNPSVLYVYAYIYMLACLLDRVPLFQTTWRHIVYNFLYMRYVRSSLGKLIHLRQLDVCTFTAPLFYTRYGPSVKKNTKNHSYWTKYTNPLNLCFRHIN